MKMKMWKYLSAALLALLLMLTMSAALAEETPLTDFDYTLLDGRILLQKYTGTSKSVHVAGSYTIDGKEYGVTIDTATTFRNNAKITSVTLEEGIRFATTVNGSLRNNSMQGLFQYCTELVSVDLSEISTAGVTDMSYMFSRCQKLSALDVSNFDTSSVTNLEWFLDYCMNLTSLTGYENWDTSKVENIYKTFNRVSYNYSADKYHDTRIQEIDISNWDLSGVKNSGWCFQNCRVNAISLPDNLAVISAGFLNHAAQFEGSSFTVPAGVKKIGYAHTFYDMGGDGFTELKVAAGNTCYKAVDGIIYSMDGTELLGIPRSKTFENNTLVIPEGVTFLAELSFSRNYNIHTVLLPNSYKIRQVIPENDPQYIVFEDNGNLNGGNSLSVATYVNTGVLAYSVKADHPLYASKDGIIYSKDMTELIAVPLRYNRQIAVPEGVRKWLKEATSEYASWDQHLKNSSGVSIPSTMVEIDPNQIIKLNRMVKQYKTFKITVHEDNAVYYVDESGYLQECPNVYGAEVTLDCTTFTYDGTEKQPVPTVTAGDTLLTKGTDYTVTYMNNINAGTGIVHIEGTGAYLGETDVSFTIQPKNIEGASLLLTSHLIWNGEYQTQPFSVNLPDDAWTVSGNTACHAGVYRLTIQGKGNYTGSVSCLYEIAPDTALLDSLNESNVTQAHLPELLKIRAMMSNADTALANEDTLARYQQITEKCEALIALLQQLPETGDTSAYALWWGMTLLSGALLCLLWRKKGRTA